MSISFISYIAELFLSKSNKFEKSKLSQEQRLLNTIVYNGEISTICTIVLIEDYIIVIYNDIFI